MISKPNPYPLPPLNSNLSQMKRPSLRDAVILQLKEAILSGELKDGQRLNEVEVAQWLGVSRGVVREAIRELEADGILAYEPYRGTFVRAWTAERVQELYSLRSVLEEYAIELAVGRIHEDDIEQLSSLVEGMRQAAQENNPSRVANLDLEFHKKLYILSGHSLLIDTLNNLNGQTHLLLMATHCLGSLYPSLEEVADAHVSVLVALLGHDRKRARQEVKNHINEAGEKLVEFLEREMREETSRKGAENAKEEK